MKNNSFLKVTVIILMIIIIILLAILAYKYYQNYSTKKDTEEFVDSYTGDEVTVVNIPANETKEENSVEENTSQATSSGSNTTQTTTSRKTYKGFTVCGTMEIPAINFKYPVLEEVTPESLNTAVAFLYGVGLNQVGNTVIIGHNYKNGLFFSNNNKLTNGDKIYITDSTGTQLTYTIYNKFQTTAEDVSFYERDTDGKAEVTLSTCTDDSTYRIIIFARED